MDAIQESQQTTPLDHLPNTSTKEEDLVNKILSELEDKNTTVDTIEEEELPEIPIQSIQTQPILQKTVYLPPPVLNEEKESFFTKLMTNIDLDDMYYYIKLGLIASILFFLMVQFSHKFNFILEKIPSALQDGQLTQVGNFIKSILFGVLLSFSSLVVLK